MIPRALFRIGLAAALAIALSACGKSDSERLDPSIHGAPALWEIRGPGGAVEGWLFGTIHALPDGFAWRTPLLDDRLRKADMLVVEVAGLDNDGALSRQFRQLAFGHPTGPVRSRLAPDRRQAFDRLLADAGVPANRFDAMESWAAALSLAQMAQNAKAANGVDRALLGDFRGREVVELEGGAKQLGLFDSLPEKEQRDLLDAVFDEAAAEDQDIGQLAAAWRKGDIDELAMRTQKGILADPELRQALLVNRNRDWAVQIENLLSTPRRPFIAVGTGHLIGSDGLPKLLAESGYTVTRIQ